MKLKNKTKKMLSRNDILNNFFDGTRLIFSDVDISRTAWPAGVLQIEPYFCDIISTTIFNKFKQDPEKCRQALKQLSAFTLYASLYHTEIIGLKVGKIFEHYPKSQKDILDFVFFLFEIIEEKIQNKLFCLDKKHQILTENQIIEIEKNLKIIKPNNSKIRKEISLLIISLENLIWALYFDLFPHIGNEKHGPYHIADNNVILAREYFNLNPKEIWDIKNKYKSVKIYLKYPKNTNIQFTYANLIKTPKSLQNELISFAIFVDEKQINSISEIRFLSQYFFNLAEKQAGIINKLPPLEIIKKGAEIYYYRYKDFFDYYNEDWRPPQQVYDRINGLKLRWWKYFEETRNEKKPVEYYIKLLNPRNDFIG